MQQLISIIIPTYNRGKLISETIESVLTQTYSNWELIIVDDFSTDNSLEIINAFAQKDARIKIFQRKREPKGASTCRNIGAQNANGQYLIFLDSDDLLASFCLEQRIKLMHQNQKLDFAVFNIEFFQYKAGDLKQKFNIYYKTAVQYINSFLMDSPPWQTTCLIWRKEAFIDIGGFDENFWVMDDPELHVRALLSEKLEFDVFIDSKTDCFYRINYTNNSQSNKFYKDSIEGRIMFLKKIYSLIQYSEKKELLRTLRKGIKGISKNWFFAHISQFETGIFEFLNWSKTNDLLSLKDFYLGKIICKLWLKNYKVIELFRIKGILTRFFYRDKCQN